MRKFINNNNQNITTTTATTTADEITRETNHIAKKKPKPMKDDKNPLDLACAKHKLMNPASKANQ